MASRLLHAADELYRRRWWISAALAVVFVGVLGPLDKGVIGGLAVLLAAVLLWIPGAVRWWRAVRDSRQAFRDGLAGR
jgi:hypothetical protein